MAGNGPNHRHKLDADRHVPQFIVLAVDAVAAGHDVGEVADQRDAFGDWQMGIGPEDEIARLLSDSDPCRGGGGVGPDVTPEEVSLGHRAITEIVGGAAVFRDGFRGAMIGHGGPNAQLIPRIPLHAQLHPPLSEVHFRVIVVEEPVVGESPGKDAVADLKSLEQPDGVERLLTDFTCGNAEVVGLACALEIRQHGPRPPA